jgi:DNA excision repair protein ERCC-2
MEDKNITDTTINGVEWESVLDIFGYDQPREQQLDGMQLALETVGDEGYFVLEGACGTGKTMLSLPPLISLVRSPKTKFEQIVVVTSVKQQQRAFEDDLRQINKNLPDAERPVSGLTLVGKSDVNPYSRHSVIDENVYDHDERVRENTREVIDASENKQKRAKKLISTAESMTTSRDWGDDAPDYPYPPMVPVTEGGLEFSPFYAQYVHDSFEDSDVATIPYNLKTQGLVKPEELVELAGEAGTSPHAVMGDALEEVEVIIANYYHIFDPQTVAQFSDELINDETLLIADEAHNLVPSVRDLLCDELSAVSLPRAQDEIENLVSLATADLDYIERAKGYDLTIDWETTDLPDPVLEEAEKAKQMVEDDSFPASNMEEFIEMSTFVKGVFENVDSSVSAEVLESYNTFLDDLLDVIDQKITEKLQDEYGDYYQDADIDHKLEIPLRDPDTPQEDTITQWASLSGNSKYFRKSDVIGQFVDQCYEHLYTEIKERSNYPTVYTSATGTFLSNWITNDYSTFFREITIRERWDEKDTLETESPWEKFFKVNLELKNCIPSNRLSERLQEFGGGIFMSATLEPIENFKEVTGITQIEELGRPVAETRYGLSFPERNRESLAVSAPAFKYSSKGPQYTGSGRPNTDGDIRGNYSTAIKSVVKTTRGNVLVSMPSYSEAKWVAEFLSEDFSISKDILLDESSTNAETEELKQSFFNSQNNVLVTGAHGTLVEGVDYKDEKLDAVAVCGVPLENSHSPYKRAIKAAYSDKFGGNGFEYAFTIPAIRKARQSIGRVIRSETDIGVRVLIDERYTDSERWDSVRQWIPEGELSEFSTTDVEHLENRLDAFWKYQRKQGNY